MLRKHLHFDGLAKPAFMMFAATMIGGACNFLYQSWMGKSLNPADYSELISLLSLFYILAVPSNLVGTTVLRYVSIFNADKREGDIAWLLRRSFIISMIIGAVLMVVVLILSPWMVDSLKLPEESILIILALGGLLLMLGPTAVGGTQALQRFYCLGVYNLATPIAKLLLGVLLVTAGLGVGGAFGGAVVGSTLAFGVVYWGIKDYWGKDRTKPDTHGMALYAIPVAIATISFMLITNIDAVLARALMTEYDAGIYASASTLGKVVLWIPVGITSVTFPRFSEADAKGDESEMLMRKSLLIVFLVLVTIWIGCTLFPNDIMNIVYTYHYAEAAICLPVVIAAFSLFGLASIFMNYGLARSDNAFIAILAIFSGLGVIAILLNHQTPIDIGYDMLIAGAGICISSLLYMELRWWNNRRKRAKANGTR